MYILVFLCVHIMRIFMQKSGYSRLHLYTIVFRFIFLSICISKMADLSDLFSRLDSLEVAQRRRTMDHLNTLEGAGSSGGATGGATRVVVDTTHHVTRKLRLFSGKTHTPGGEVDFETWFLLAKQILEDASIPEADQRRIVTQSLLRPALDTIRGMPTTSTAKEYVDTLKDMFGTVADGHELLMKCHCTFQEEKELASDYLMRLNLILLDSADRGGISVSQVPKYLLKQFIRGCSDDLLIQKLRLEEKVSPVPPATVPPVHGLLLSVRQEEARRTEKKLLLRKARSLVAVATPKEVELQAQVQQLKAQMQQLQQKVDAKEKPNSQQQQGASGWSNKPRDYYGPRVPQQHQHQPRPTYHNRPSKSRIFCYNCGKDGHVIRDCYSQSNSTLVQEKRRQRDGGFQPRAGHQQFMARNQNLN